MSITSDYLSYECIKKYIQHNKLKIEIVSAGNNNIAFHIYESLNKKLSGKTIIKKMLSNSPITMMGIFYKSGTYFKSLAFDEAFERVKNKFYKNQPNQQETLEQTRQEIKDNCFSKSIPK